MFKLNEKYGTKRNILKCDCIRYNPSEIGTIDTPNSQIYINIPTEDSGVLLLNSYFELNLDVLYATTSNRYVDVDDERIVNLGPMALFSKFKLTTSSAEQVKNIDHAHIVSLMCKLLISTRGSDVLSIGFERGRRQRELTNYKNIRGNYHVRIYLKDTFGFVEYQDIGTFGLGCKLTLTINTDNVVLNKGNAIKNEKIQIIGIQWYVTHYTSSLDQLHLLMKLILDKTKRHLHNFNIQKGLFS